MPVVNNKTESKFKEKKGKFKSQCYPELVSGSKKQVILKKRRKQINNTQK